MNSCHSRWVIGSMKFFPSLMASFQLCIYLSFPEIHSSLLFELSLYFNIMYSMLSETRYMAMLILSLPKERERAYSHN